MNDTSSDPKIALFGTSADPPTTGHQTILEWLSRHYDLVLVWASENPFKAHQTNLQDRAAMLNLIIREIDTPRDNIILCQPISDRRTLVTVQKAEKIWHDAEFTFVIGADLVEQIVNWYRVEALLDRVKILIVPRNGYQIKQSALANLKLLGGRYTIANFNAPQVSSSLYRLQGDNKAITPAVQNYIQQEKLYSDTWTKAKNN